MKVPSIIVGTRRLRFQSPWPGLTTILILILISTSPVQASDLPGSVSVKLEHPNRTEFRAGLVVGDIPNPIGWSVVLLPGDAIYSPDLDPDYLRSLSSASGGDGQVLDLPTIELDTTGSGLRTLSMVALSRGSWAGVAACMRHVSTGQAVRIATAGIDGKLQAISGHITALSPSRNHIALDSGNPIPRIGDPVYVVSTSEPQWRVLGVISSVQGPRNIEFLPLPEIYRRLPPETGAWALHPLGLCDTNQPSKEAGQSPELMRILTRHLRAIRAEIKDHGVVGEVDLQELVLQWMQRSWPDIRNYLDQPGIEHYFFQPGLEDEQQSWQFWQSAMTLDEGLVQLLSPIAAAGPVVRVRTQLPKGKTDRGWALAVAYTPKAIVLLTANHLVKPSLGRERDIQVSFPAMQGLGMDAIRLPLVDESLDIAVIAVPVPDELREKVFSIYHMACPNQLDGPVQVPMSASGWRRQRLSGSARHNSVNDTLIVTGVDVTQGFSGGTLIKEGNLVAGMLTKDHGKGQGALAVPIHTAMKLFPFAEMGIKPLFCQPPVTLEQKVQYQTVRSLLGRNRGLAKPDHGLIAKLFSPTDAVRIRVDEIPSLHERYWEGKEDIPDGTKTQWNKTLDALELQYLNGMATQQDTRCAILQGQTLEPTSQDVLDMISPIGPDGRPTVTQDDTLGCNLPRTGPRYPRPALLSSLDIPVCMSLEGAIALHIDNRLWDGSFLSKCKNLEFGWYVPPGWLKETAASAPLFPEKVQVPAGEFQMGGCQEYVPNSARRWNLKCQKTRESQTFRSSTRAYSIQRFPVTVAEYARCVSSGRCRYLAPEPDITHAAKSKCHWGQPGRARHPMNCISWTNADEYCRAIGGRLPAEAEWEKAARGTDGRQLPWKDANLDLRVISELLDGGTMEVGLAPDARSPYGVEDMAWHIEEWTHDLYEPYHPQWTGKTLLGDDYQKSRVLRGGTTFERKAWPLGENRDADKGFRCAFN